MDKAKIKKAYKKYVKRGNRNVDGEKNSSILKIGNNST